MAGVDLLYDDDGDYIDDGAGYFEETETAQPAVRHQMLDELDAWVGDPALGRDQTTTRLNSQRDADRRANSVRNAYQPLVDDGLIEELSITVDTDAAGRWGNVVTAKDTSTGAPFDFERLSPFGGDLAD
jgi:hypothetical protein